MKLIKSFRVFVSLLSTIAVLAIPIAMVGCSSGCKSPTRNAYVTSGVTHVAATSGLRLWNDYLGVEYAAIKALPDSDAKAARHAKVLEQEKEVKAAYEKYQAAQIAVLTAAQEFGKIPPSDPNAPASQDRLNAAIAASAATLDAVIDVLTKFGVKIP